MKTNTGRCIAIPTLLCLIPLLAFGKTLDELTADELADYNRKKLTIKVDDPESANPRWQVYEGYGQITEVEFFTLLELDEEAQQAAEHYGVDNNVLPWVLIGAGSVVSLLSIPILSGYESNVVVSVTAGTIVLTLGIVAFAVGFEMLLIPQTPTEKGNWAEAWMVMDLVDAYNQELLDQIIRVRKSGR